MTPWTPLNLYGIIASLKELPASAAFTLPHQARGLRQVILMATPQNKRHTVTVTGVLTLLPPTNISD